MHIVFWLLLFSFSLSAHQTSLTSGGNELFWPNPNVPIAIKTNTTDMSSANVISVIQSSMNQWNSSSSAKITSVASAQNEIRFVSDMPYGSAVVGLTEVSYNSSGAIQKAVISLNDSYFFRPTPGIYTGGQLFLGDVVTHEIGHLFGLSHSEVLNSTMFYANFSGQSTVAFDDVTGIRQKYDSGYGSITGQVKGGAHIGVLGVHVQAISRSSGESTSVITDEHGNFHLGGLNLNDTYYIYTSPTKNPESLPGHLANVQDAFCPGKYVGSFYSGCGRTYDGKPYGIEVTAENPSVDVGTVSISCSLRADQNYSFQKLQTSFTPVKIFDFIAEERVEKSFVGWFLKQSTSSWSSDDRLLIDLKGFGDLDDSQKYLKVSLVSYPFGNLIEYQMDVKQGGALVPTASRTTEGPLANGTFMTDFSSFLPLSPDYSLNEFEVLLRARKISSVSSFYPSALNFTTEEQMPYLLIASIWEMTPQGLQPFIRHSAVNLSDNEACLDAPFTYAVAKARTFDERNSGSSDQVSAAAGCGTIEPPDNGPTSSLPLMTAGFLFTLVVSSFFKGRKKFLS